MAELLVPGGELVTLIFPVADYEGGPPYAMSEGLVRSLLEAHGFVCTSIMEVPEHLLARPALGKGKELIARWSRGSIA